MGKLVGRTSPEKASRDAAVVEVLTQASPTAFEEPDVLRPNRELDRNQVIVAAIRAGVSSSHLARINDVSRQRIQQIWKAHGDGYNIFEHRRKLKEQGRL